MGISEGEKGKDICERVLVLESLKRVKSGNGIGGVVEEVIQVMPNLRKSREKLRIFLEFPVCKREGKAVSVQTIEELLC